MTIRASIEIVETNEKIAKDILKALKPQVEAFFQKAFESVKDNLADIVINAIKTAPEYSALIDGQLKAEFGLPDSVDRVSTIIDKWSKVQFKYEKVVIKGSLLFGSFSFNMIKSDYSDVINLPVASFITEKRSTLNWLEWLLLFGNQTIIKDYNVVLGSNPRSRTGMAVMKGVNSGKWSVPTQYAGTPNDNWITRAIDSADSQIMDLLNKSLRA
jgi:hypothetical protein